MSFTHLHLHTCYSLLDGASKISDVVKTVKSLGQKSVAITDHGAMYGAIEFFKECVINGIKPIIGAEVYVVSGSRFDRNAPTENRYHLILLCENNIGYKNLLKIVSSGFKDGFYYKPRVDYEILSRYSEGLICLTACLAGEVPSALVMGDYNLALTRAKNLKSVFGEKNFFIEIQNHGISEELRIHPDLVRISKELNVPLVATNDCHYTLKSDSFAHDSLICIQTGKKIIDTDRMKYEKEKYYIKSEDEMRELFKFADYAIDNTELIASRCEVHIKFTRDLYLKLQSKIDENFDKGLILNKEYFKSLVERTEYHVPKFDIPNSISSKEYLEKLVYDGINEKYNRLINKNIDIEKVKLRAKYELDTIIKMGFVDYFLVVWDYINFSKKNNIPVGPGRGSAVGSVVSYALDITDVEPTHLNLLFERFLNPERVSMPDIDTDFCVIGRDKVIDYVKRKYGVENVAQIVTFGTLAAKAVLNDMGRVMGIDLQKTRMISGLVATRALLDQSKPTLEKMLNSDISMFSDQDKDNVEKFRTLYENDLDTKKMVDTALRLEGIPRQASVHASGVLIAPEDISNFVPFARGKEKIEKSATEKNSDTTVLVTEYDMKTLEELGLLKMDFLGLRNLTAIKDCINMIEGNHIDINEIPYNDTNIYRMISNGDTLGIFQLESPGMTSFMQRLKPTVLEDLIAGISLYRPGPMDFIPKYIEGKHSSKEITYEHPLLKKILEPTYGCIVYQEQVMQIVQDLAGYTLGQADQVRRLMSKKKAEPLKAERKNFIYGNEGLKIKGAIKNGVSEEIANKIFDELISFASYAFNKSHAAAYATVAYQTAYLKYYYKAEFFTSICNSVIFKREMLSSYVGAIILSGIKILPVDINYSFDEFTVEGKNIRMGFAAIKRVGASISSAIIEERTKNGLYKTFRDAVKRIASVGGNKNAFEALIMCGAFDSFYGNRNQKMHAFPNIVDASVKRNKQAMLGEITIFEYLENTENIDNSLISSDEELINEYSEIADFTEKEKLLTEKEYTGIYLSGHPLTKYKNFINRYVNLRSVDLYVDEENENENTYLEDGKKVRAIVIVDEIKMLKTKRLQENMAILTTSDMEGQIKVVVFPKVYELYKNIIDVNKVLYISGKLSVDSRTGEGEIFSEKIVDMEEYIKIHGDFVIEK